MPPWPGIKPSQRIAAARMLFELTDDWAAAREIEAACHWAAGSRALYRDKVLQIAHNLEANPSLLAHGAALSVMSDERMAQGTIVEDIANQAQQRRERFDKYMEVKYELMNDASLRSTLQCRRCGCADVSWEQKQTRGADEAMTVFCTCNKCQNRWKMR